MQSMSQDVHDGIMPLNKPAVEPNETIVLTDAYRHIRTESISKKYERHYMLLLTRSQEGLE
jgi:hypothetical protein